MKKYYLINSDRHTIETNGYDWNNVIYHAPMNGQGFCGVTDKDGNYHQIPVHLNLPPIFQRGEDTTSDELLGNYIFKCLHHGKEAYISVFCISEEIGKDYLLNKSFGSITDVEIFAAYPHS